MNEFFECWESDQEWMTLEDYCLERDLLLDDSQLIKEGLDITRYLSSNGLPLPQKLAHERYGTVNGYRRCTLDRWYEEFMPRYEPPQSTSIFSLPSPVRRMRLRAWNRSKAKQEEFQVPPVQVTEPTESTTT
jgi:hypothetical protein